MLPIIPSEGSYTSWLAQCLQKYFESLGFKFFYEIQTQSREKNYPFDILAGVEKGNFVKRFGLQVKRPDQSKQDLYWKLDSVQHKQMKKFTWIWYALPDFLDRHYHKVTCFHTLFKNPNFGYISALHKSKIGFYLRLGAFASKVEECSIGEKLSKGLDLLNSEELFKEFSFANQIHTYLDFTEMKAQLFTNIKPESNEQG